MAEKLAELNKEYNNRPAIYSTTERRVGEWVDGKPLYQITVNIGALPLVSAGVITINTALPNIKDVCQTFGVAIEHSTPGLLSSNIPLPHISTSGSSVMIYAGAKTDILYISVATSGTADRRNYTGYVTVQYTKTTD
jgi:hypothetical protein